MVNEPGGDTNVDFQFSVAPEEESSFSRLQK
jgi:hypothetical protein